MCLYLQHDFDVKHWKRNSSVRPVTLNSSFTHIFTPSILLKVIRTKHEDKARGFGFVSFMDPMDCAKAIREMQGKYLGTRYDCDEKYCSAEASPTDNFFRRCPYSEPQSIHSSDFSILILFRPMKITRSKWDELDIKQVCWSSKRNIFFGFSSSVYPDICLLEINLREKKSACSLLLALVIIR